MIYYFKQKSRRIQQKTKKILENKDENDLIKTKSKKREIYAMPLIGHNHTNK